MDYTRYQTLHITRRGKDDAVLDIQMRADGPGGNGRLPTAGHAGHWELSDIWRDVGADDSVRAAVLRGDGMGFSGGGDLALVQDMVDDVVDQVACFLPHAGAHCKIIRHVLHQRQIPAA